MEVTTPSLSEAGGTTLKPSSPEETRGNLDRFHDESGSIFLAFAGALGILLVLTVLGVLWNWNKQRKRRRPSRRVRVFSTESLLSRNSESPLSVHLSSQAGGSLPGHRAPARTRGYPVGIYDDVTQPRGKTSLSFSAHQLHGAAGGSLSISSEDSRDYVNAPSAEDLAGTSPRGLSARAQEPWVPKGRDQPRRKASEGAGFWSPGTGSNDSLSDDGDSSQTSNDYVNMAGLDLKAIQGQCPCLSLQPRGDYVNAPPAHPNGSQQRAEAVTCHSAGRVEGRTGGQGTQGRPAQPSGRVSDFGDYVPYQPSLPLESSQMKLGEEVSHKDAKDYENMQAVKSGARDLEPGLGPDAGLPRKEGGPSSSAGKLHGFVCPARSKPAAGLLVKSQDQPRAAVDSSS